MSGKTIGFVGAGRVARILLHAWTRGNAVPRQIAVSDPNKAACETLKSAYPTIDVCADVAVAANRDVVFLAVHPPVIADAAAAIRPALARNAIVVSLAPKFTIAKLSGLLGGFERIARVVPNAPSFVGKGFNPVTYAPALSVADKSAIAELCGVLGEMPEVPEPQLEAYAILSAMGPTYFWPQLYELVALGEKFGLTRAHALEAVDKMLRGTLATMNESGLSPEEVQDLIPGKPVAEDVAALTAAYRTKLSGLLDKLRP